MSELWYKDGLQFTCTRCGNCCTGQPGYVWVEDVELHAIASLLGEPVSKVSALYSFETHGKRSLREKANGDCVFFQVNAGCTIYPVRPRQCQTWPFWESNVVSNQEWERTQATCPGAGHGELIPVEEITRRIKVIRL